MKQIDAKAFVIAYEPRTIHGGFWARGVRSRKIKQYDTDEVESIYEEATEVQSRGQ